MVSLCKNMCTAWSSWNYWLEKETTNIAQRLSQVLPRPIIPLVQTNRLTQMQLLVHFLGIGILVGLSVANPFVPMPAALAIVGIGVAVTAKPLFRYLSSYVREISHLPLKEKVIAVAVPLLLGAVGIGGAFLGKGILFSHGLRSSCSVLLAACIALPCINSIINMVCCHDEDRIVEIKRNPVEEERQKEERKVGELREEVEKLRTMKVKLEAYVAARPKLQEECSRALEKDPKVIDTATPVSLDGIDEEGRLMIERNNLRYDLEVRLNFIMAYKNVYDSFKEHLAQEGLPEIEWINYGK